MTLFLALSKKVGRIRKYLDEGRDFKRWRFWACFQGSERELKASKEIENLSRRGFKSKVWAPLPIHRGTGHIHIVVLATFEEFGDLSGIRIIST